MQHRFIIALYIAPRAVGCMQWFPGIVSHCRWGAGLFFEGMTFSCIEPRFRRGWLLFSISLCVLLQAPTAIHRRKVAQYSTSRKDLTRPSLGAKRSKAASPKQLFIGGRRETNRRGGRRLRALA